MKKNKIIFIIIGVTIISVFVVYQAASLIAPGHYPNAEEYKLNISDSELIIKIAKFKANNAQYIPPASTQLIDKWDSEIHFYYFIYFYYPQENQIVFTYIRNNDEPQSILGFVSINYGLSLGNWKDINKDFSDSEKCRRKENF